MDFNTFYMALSQHFVDHVRILQHGQLIGSYDTCPNERQNQYSLTKSITGTAVGFALSEGLFQMNSRLVDLLPDYVPVNHQPEMEQVTVKHLLTMTEGQKDPQLLGDSRTILDEPDWAKYIMEQPFLHRPGWVFQYSNFGPYLLGLIIERVSGKDLPEYLMPRLFEPLGIEFPEWERDRQGRPFGAGGIVLSTDEVAKFGQLYLQDGVWEGKQLVPEDWIKAVKRTSIPVGEGEQEYSLLFWRSRHDSISAVGKFGQYCTILKDKDAVVVINSHDKTNTNLLEYLWTYVYPKL